MVFMERNLEQLSTVQKKLMDQNSVQKKELASVERKLAARTERVSGLELTLLETQGRVDSITKKYESAVETLRSKVAGGGSWGALARIAKPLRGRGAKETTGESDDEVEPLAMSSANPRKKMGSKRSSWYLSLLNQNKENQ
jgi:kinesin family protein 5